MEQMKIWKLELGNFLRNLLQIILFESIILKSAEQGRAETLRVSRPCSELKKGHIMEKRGTPPR